MTRKDYVLIAEAMAFAINSLSDVQFEKCNAGWERSIIVLADYLQADNPNFDRQKFISACKSND